MELQIVSFEQAKKLKELGFDWRVTGAYKEDGTFYCIALSNLNSKDEYHYSFWGDLSSAPTVELALEWFRIVKGIPNAVELVNKHIGIIAVEEYSCSYIWDGRRFASVEYFDKHNKAASALLDFISDKLLKLETIKN